MKRLEALAWAILKHEGYFPGSSSWKNDNPGNLRASRYAAGTADGFATFPSFVMGFVALEWDLLAKCTGNTAHGLNGNSTLANLIAVYAPEADGNDVPAYIQSVCKTLDIDPTTPLSYFAQPNL